MEDAVAQVVIVIGALASFIQVGEYGWRFVGKDQASRRQIGARVGILLFGLALVGGGIWARSAYKTADQYYRLSINAYQGRNFPAAIRLAESAVRKDPEHLKAHIQLGALYALKGNNEMAERSFGRALHVDPLSLDAHIGLARIFETQNHNQKALQHYEYAKRATNDLSKIAEINKSIQRVRLR